MRGSRVLVFLLSIVICCACYHARVETGATPSTVTIDKSWSASWIFGLVPPKILETAGKCPDGVAKVETKLSFPNQVVGFLTLGIYTPMEVTVTCAQARNARGEIVGPDVVIGEGAGEEEILEAFNRAATESRRLGRPVLIRF